MKKKSGLSKHAGRSNSAAGGYLLQKCTGLLLPARLSPRIQGETDTDVVIRECTRLRQCGRMVLSESRPQSPGLPALDWVGGFDDIYMWHFMGKGPIWSVWSYCQGRVLWSISKHLRAIPPPTVENCLSNRHLNLKNKKSENFKILRNRNLNIFFQKKAISSSCMWISGYDIIYKSSASNHQQLWARK